MIQSRRSSLGLAAGLGMAPGERSFLQCRGLRSLAQLRCVKGHNHENRQLNCHLIMKGLCYVLCGSDGLCRRERLA
jgi:hypothetical protein